MKLVAELSVNYKPKKCNSEQERDLILNSSINCDFAILKQKKYNRVKLSSKMNLLLTEIIMIL